MNCRTLWTCLLFLPGYLMADWDPQRDLLGREYSYDFTVLEVSTYQIARSRAEQKVRGSNCYGEKARLLFDLVVLTEPKNVVDVGTGYGNTIYPIAAALGYLQKGKVFAVDAWSTSVALRNLSPTDPHYQWWSKMPMDHVYGCFAHKIKPFAAYCHVIRKTSLEAIELLPKIDILHMDGDPTSTGALHDIECYLGKVRPNGYILISGLKTWIHGEPQKKEALALLDSCCERVCTIGEEEAALFCKTE